MLVRHGHALPRSAASAAVSAWLSAILLAIPACAGLVQPWQSPEVIVTSLRPERIGLDEQSLLVGLRIKNPNDRRLPINAMTYKLTLAGDQIAQGGGRLERQIPAFGEESVEVSVIGSAATLLRKVPALALQSRPWEYEISGTVTVAGVVPLPYRYAGEMDPQKLLRTLMF